MLKFNERLKGRSIARILCCLIFVGIVGESSDLTAQRAAARRPSRNRASQNALQNAYYPPNQPFKNPALSTAPDSAEITQFLKTNGKNTPAAGTAAPAANSAAERISGNASTQNTSDSVQNEPISTGKKISASENRNAIHSKQDSESPNASKLSPDLALADSSSLESERGASRGSETPNRRATNAVDPKVQNLAENQSFANPSSPETFRPTQSAETSFRNPAPSGNLTHENGKMSNFSAQNPQPGKQPKCFWFTNWDEARAAAIETGRPLLIHFSSQYCAPCRQMETTVFTEAAVQILAGSYFAAVKVDGSKSAKLCNFFKVEKFPTDLIVAPSGDVLARHTGFQDANQYCSFLGRAAAKAHLSPMTVPLGPDWRMTVKNSTISPFNNTKPISADTNASAKEKNPTVARTEIPKSPNPYFSQTKNLEEGILEPPAANVGLNENQNDGMQTKYEDEEVLDLLSLPKRNHDENGNVSDIAANNQNVQDIYSLETPEQTQKQIPDLNESLMNVEPVNAPSQDWELASKKTLDSEMNSPNAYLRASYSPESADPIPTLMDGYCPVAMVERNAWIQGDSQITCLYGNGRYCFENNEAKEKFFRNPAFYALVSDGMDIVLLTDQNRKTPGTRRLGIRYADLNFVFATKESLEKFRQNPDFYLKYAREQIANEAKKSVR